MRLREDVRFSAAVVRFVIVDSKRFWMAPSVLRSELVAVKAASTRVIAVFAFATEALGKIKSPDSIKALGAAIDDRDPAMQYVAVQSMKNATGKDYGPDVQAWRQVAAG